MKIRILLLLAYISLFPTYVPGKERISFARLEVNDQLSQNTVLDIEQDRHGFLWIATNGGLNRYDGYECRIFRYNERDAGSIGSDFIKTLRVDRRGHVWIGTDRGLSCFDADRDRFRNFTYSHPGLVSHIVEMDSTHLLVNYNGQLVIFNTTDYRFRKLGLCRLKLPTVTALHGTGDNIYIGTRHGVYRYSISARRLSRLRIPGIDGQYIQVIYLQSASRLWIGTEGGGLFMINTYTKACRHFTSDNTPLSSSYVRAISSDRQGRLWIGTVNGLNLLSANGEFTHVDAERPETAGATHTSVRCIKTDSQGGIWIGTYFEGLKYYNPKRSRFANLHHIPGMNSLNNDVIGCLVEDSRQRLWIGTNGGVNCYDPNSNPRFTHYTTENGLRSNDIKAIYVDEKRNIVYIGSQLGGLGLLHRGSGKVTSVVLGTANADDNSLYAIVPDDMQAGLWLGTLTGLKYYDCETGRVYPIGKDAAGQPITPRKIRTIIKDSRGNLWMGGDEGISAYTVRQGKLRKLKPALRGHQVGDATVYTICYGRNDDLWVGTRQGLFHLDLKTRRSTQLTADDGLPSNVVYGILQDSDGKLWISTDYGLCSYTPATRTFRQFAADDGIPNRQFMPNSFCRTRSGHLLFGGINGVTDFIPEKLTDNPFTPPVVITELRLFNNIVRPEKDGILRQQIETTKRITLKHSQSMFSLKFAVANYSAGTHNTFAYILDGYEKAWHYIEDARTVSYSNLPHGTYRFLVKAANNDGIWNDTPTQLEIVILPAWYNTWWARLAYLLIASGIVFAAFRYFLYRKTMELKLEQERQEQRRTIEINEMKQRFFIDISHEFRTPLTLIASPLDEVRHQTQDPWTQKKLDIVHDNVNRLLRLVNQLMDYRRVELGVFKLKVRPTALDKLVRQTFILYTETARNRQIDYTVDIGSGCGDVLCDPNYVELILNNLLSNAFKYTPDGQSIRIRLGREADQVVLEVADTGQGIPESKQEKIFERFYQGDGIHMGSGIGLSIVSRIVQSHHGNIRLKSRPGEGSTFTIQLPATAAAYTAEETATEKEIAEGSLAQYTINRTDTLRSSAKPASDTVDTTDADSPRPLQQDEKRETVLVVEDNEGILAYLREALMEHYAVLTAPNGKKALQLLDLHEVNLILTDVMMPVMDGIQFCRQVKRNLQTSHIPVIILSAKADVQEQMEGLEVGADDYIPKPFSIAVVTAKIRNILRTRQLTLMHYAGSTEVEPARLAANPIDADFLDKAIRTVEAHLDDSDFSTEQFAREMLMSRSNLHLKMKALTGESTNDFIKRLRFNKACTLLKEGRYNISEISYRVGFSSPSYFATSFKKRFGCLPTEYADRAAHDFSASPESPPETPVAE